MDREKVATEIARTRKAIRKKYRALKVADDTSARLFSKAFKPLITPLESIDKNIKKEWPKKEEIKWMKTDLDDIDEDTYNKKDFEEDEDNSINHSIENSLDEMDLKEYPSLNESMNRRVNLSQSIRDEQPAGTPVHLGPYGRSYLSFMHTNDYDTTYGPHMDKDTLKLGKYDVTLQPNDDIRIGDRTFDASSGLYSLLFEKDPKFYSPEDLDNYKTILELTKTHLRRDGKIKANLGQKYRNVIQKLFPPAKKGRGIMSLNNKPVEYIYYDDMNELVDRLEILVREQNAGHSGHNNEIQSILEELKEVGLIKSR